MSQQVAQQKGEEQRHEGDDDKPEVVEEAQHQMGRQWKGARLQKQEDSEVVEKNGESSKKVTSTEIKYR